MKSDARGKHGVKIALMICATLVCATFVLINGYDKVKADEQEIEILFTSDIHSYLLPHQTQTDGEPISVGGMTRVATFVNEKRKANPDVLLFDGGDYPMGTLFQTLYAQEAYEYRILSEVGYDAITFGNHDFDYGSQALADQFTAAGKAVPKENRPDFLVCNINWAKDDFATKTIYDSLKEMNLKEYAVYERNGYTIGVTGCVGYDAIKCAPTCELELLDPIESVKATVAKMKEECNPDMIVLLSHSGTNEDPKKSEDENMAKEVPDIDFILSGHAHTAQFDAKKVGDTYIGSCGCYSEYVGEITLSRNSKGRFDLKKYELTEMDSSIEEDPKVAGMLASFLVDIDKCYLKDYGYDSDDVIAYNPYDFSSVDDLYFVKEDHNLGNLIADAYRWNVDHMKSEDTNPVALSVAPAGTIRATYPKGELDVAKLFESYSIGNGADGSVGYPLTSVYITGEEIITLCEIDATISNLMNSASLYLSGVRYEINPNRAFLNRVADVKLNREILKEDLVDIDPDKLYRVVTDMYSVRMLGAVKSTSKGLLSIEIKDANGNPIEREEDIIIHDENGNELKAWVAIANYMASFDANDEGTPEIPKEYQNGILDRKVIVDSKKPVDTHKNPNKFLFMFYAMMVIVIALFLFPAVLFIKKSREKNKRDALLDEKDKLIDYLSEKVGDGHENKDEQ